MPRQGVNGEGCEGVRVWARCGECLAQVAGNLGGKRKFAKHRMGSVYLQVKQARAAWPPPADPPKSMVLDVESKLSSEGEIAGGESVG